jgi:biotin transport system substrate-specific component
MSQTVQKIRNIHSLVWIGLMAALLSVGGSVAIPIGPVPITLQTLFVFLAGLILGPRGAALAVLLYWVAGSLGLPVFAGGKAGLGIFLGPTGGFLLGFLPAAVFCGLFRSFSGRSFKFLVLVCVCAACIILTLGVLQLMLVLHISLGKALAVGVIPFLPGDVPKCLAAPAIYLFLNARGLLLR